MTSWIKDLLDREESNLVRRSKEMSLVQPKDVGEKEYAYFFADLDELSTRERANLPYGVSLVHHLLISGKSVCFDLKPCSDEEFKSRHRIDIGTAFELAQNGRLFANIYDTNPDSWADVGQGVKQLVKQSGFVNWYRTRHFFNLLCPSFDERIQIRTRQIMDALEPLSDAKREQLVAVAQVTATREVPLVTGRRWAYLDAVDPSLAEQADWFLAKHRWTDLIRFVRGATLLKTSRFSGAYGKKFVWGPDHLSVITAPDLWLTQTTRREEHFGLDRNALEYLLHELTGVKELRTLDQIESHRLMKFIEDTGNSNLCEQVFDAADILPELVMHTQGKSLGINFHSYKEAVDEVQRRLNGLRVGVRHGVPIIGFAVGILVATAGWGIVGIVIGGSIALLTSVFKDLSPSIASKLYGTIDPSAMKVIATVDRLQKARSS